MLPFWYGCDSAVYVCMCMCVCVCVCVYVCMYVCVYACMHVSVYELVKLSLAGVCLFYVFLYNYSIH